MNKIFVFTVIVVWSSCVIKFHMIVHADVCNAIVHDHGVGYRQLKFEIHDATGHGWTFLGVLYGDVKRSLFLQVVDAIVRIIARVEDGVCLYQMN